MILADMPTLQTNPVLPLWLLIPLAVAAVFLVGWLYALQRRLLPRRAAFFIIAIRIALVFLVAMLLLQPSFRWTLTHTSAGTLWILADQSPSMESRDPQATTLEHFRWAQSLGKAPASARPAQPDYQLANFIAVSSSFNTLRPPVSSLSRADDEGPRVSEFVARLDAWSRDVQKLSESLAADPVASRTGAPAELQRVAQLARAGASAARSRVSLRTADDAVDWAAMQTNLQLAQDELVASAAADDDAFARSHASDPAVQNPAAVMANLTRGDLAWLFLANTARRPDGPPPPAELFKKYHVRLAGFADNTQAGGALAPSDFSDVLKSALTSTATNSHATDLAQALRFIAQQIPTDESGAVIIVSDGRSNAPSDPTEIARLLAARGVHVYGLLTGSHHVSPDAAVENIDAPDWVYADDTLRAAAIVRLDGLSGQSATVQLFRGDTPVSTQTVRATQEQQTQRVEFNDKPSGASSYEYHVKITPIAGEVNTDNNNATFRVSVKKDKLNVLFVDDRPRWEYRYLANYLARPDSPMKAQVVLLSPAVIPGVAAPAPIMASPTNTHLEAQLLPKTRDQWQAFDIIILGDIPPTALPPDAQQFIASAVRDKGATLITIAGQRFMPAAYAAAPLGEILPVTASAQFNPDILARHLKSGFHPALAPEGATSVLGQLAGNGADNASTWSAVAPWYWHSPFTQAKPAASVLWSIGDSAPSAPGAGLSDARNAALLASIPIGAGKSLYLASDQSWRLRQVNGANDHERFWGQVLRWAVGSDLPAGGRFVRFGASQQRYTQDQPVTVIARVLREDLSPYPGLKFSAVATPKTQSSVLSPQSSVEAPFTESPDTPGYYHATLGGLPIGDSEITLQGPEVERLLNSDSTVVQKSLLVTVTATPDLERRNMNTDPALLARVAQAGGGFSLDADFADVLLDHLPAVQRSQTSTHEAGFFSDPAAPGTKLAHWTFLTLFALLLTAEWSLRKKHGLI